MCGICGFLNIASRRDAGLLLSQMTASIAHRGPDGHGMWLSADGSTGLGNTRLAIIDVEGGKQPIRSCDDQLVIVFNGELYNFRSLRLELQQLGHHLFTKSDTEIVLMAYRQWGHACLERFRGMFAVAIYDSAKQELFLARDRTGIKPLYYYYSSGSGFYFGSELKAILCARDVPRRVNYEAIADLFTLGYPVLPKTAFGDIYELEPGTWMTVSSRGLKKERYWQWRRTPADRKECDIVEASSAAIVHSLQEHLISDVPVGAFLSGGIDSSLLTALTVKELGQRLQVFTVSFTESEYDESADARVVCECLGLPNTQIVLGSSCADLSLVDDVLLQFDQPFGDSSAIPTYLICRETRKSVKVVIGGDGGDEMFGGYRRFWYADLARHLGHVPRILLRFCSQLLNELRPVAPGMCRKWRKLLRAATVGDYRRLLCLSSYLPMEVLQDVLQPATTREIGDYVPELFASGEVVNDPGGEEFTDATVRVALPGDYLRKVDMMSSAHGLEVRVPFLGEEVLTVSAKMPQGVKYSFRHNKTILRKLAARYLPQSIVHKPKRGFSIPFDSWLGKNGREELRACLESPAARIAELVRRPYLTNLLAGFVRQTPNLATASRENTYQQVYFMKALEVWLARWRPSL
jgi:asparagine synthase (glutamine-hydrolysing)